MFATVKDSPLKTTMGTVLVVDNNPISRQTVIELLKQHGLKVLEANNGVEAIEKVREHFPDLVITEVVMPWMNGYELCQWLKNNSEVENKIPAVICSLRNGEFDRYWGMKKGADAYLAKPFQATELMEVLHKLLPRLRLVPSGSAREAATMLRIAGANA